MASTENNPPIFRPHLASTATLVGLTGAVLAYAMIRRRLITKHMSA
ncbi:MAG: hypothetical protein QXR13_00255 [Candidatus Bathyarchaeia archaeon]